jgi:hypothetical protein
VLPDVDALGQASQPARTVRMTSCSVPHRLDLISSAYSIGPYVWGRDSLLVTGVLIVASKHIGGTERKDGAAKYCAMGRSLIAGRRKLLFDCCVVYR